MRAKKNIKNKVASIAAGWVQGSQGAARIGGFEGGAVRETHPFTMIELMDSVHRLPTSCLVWSGLSNELLTEGRAGPELWNCGGDVLYSFCIAVKESSVLERPDLCFFGSL